MTIKVAVIYYSSTGTNYQMAQEAVKAAQAEGAEVRLLKVQEMAPAAAIEGSPAWKAHLEETAHIAVATSDDIVWADAIVFSTPTRFGNLASQMKQFLDTTGGIWAQGKTVNKAVTAMTSAQNTHGGQEATILSLYTTMFHWGAIVVAPGFTDGAVFGAGGNPYGTSVTVPEPGPLSEQSKAAIAHQTRRLLSIAGLLAKSK